MKVTFRVGDVAAGLAWVVTLALALVVTVSRDNGPLRMWAILFGFGACCLTGCLWLARKIEALREDCFAEGMRAGLDLRGVVPLQRESEHSRS